jgi:hypothetical protein
LYVNFSCVQEVRFEQVLSLTLPAWILPILRVGLLRRRGRGLNAGVLLVV